MPEILGLVASASVDAHRLLAGEEGFLRCARQVVESRREDEEERKERMQLRAADWQDNDIVVAVRVERYDGGIGEQAARDMSVCPVVKFNFLLCSK
jgi:hypothetical protein